MVPEGAKQDVFARAMPVPDPIEAGERTTKTRALLNNSTGCSFAEFAEQATARGETAIGAIQSKRYVGVQRNWLLSTQAVFLSLLQPHCKGMLGIGNVNVSITVSPSNVLFAPVSQK